MSGKTEKKGRASSNGARDETSPEKVQRTKPRPVTIFCDELTIEEGGETYHPHAGELIRLTGGATVADIKMAVDLQAFKDIDMGTEEGKAKMAEVKEGLESIVDVLAHRLQSWTWTDDNDRPYGPPTREILEGLRFEELMWILTASLKTARTDAERLKDMAPSMTS